MKYLHTLFLTAYIFLPATSSAQNIGFKTILEATKTCDSPSKFSEFIAPFGFCFVDSNEMPSFTYYTHFKCGTNEIGSSQVRVNFSISTDGSLNSSFLTRNSEMVAGFELERNEVDFQVTKENVDLTRENAIWFVSENYPGILILWEYSLDENDEKVWHIGFVWNTPEG